MTLAALAKRIDSPRATGPVMDNFELGRTLATDDEILAISRALDLMPPLDAARLGEAKWRAAAKELRARSPKLFEAMLTIAEAAIADASRR